MTEPEHPHELIEAYVQTQLGRRTQLFGPLAEDLFRPLLLGLLDQLSILTDVRPYAELELGETTWRERPERSYLIAALADRGGPLRLNAATQQWNMEVTNSTADFAWDMNGRRWRFLDKWRGRLVEPLLRQTADCLAEYYQRRPHAVPRAGLFRFMEGVDDTRLVVEVDERQEPAIGEPDSAGRYRVQ